MSLENRCSDLVSQLESYKFNLSITDGHKKIFYIPFRTFSKLLSEHEAHVLLKDNVDYKNVVDYITKTLDFDKTFRYSTDIYSKHKLYLCVRLGD